MSDQIKLTQQVLTAELAMVWATSQFFTTLQNIMLEKHVAPDASLAELYARMEALGEDVSAESSMLVEVQRALQRTRAELAIIDSRITVSIMRNFFERIGDSEEIALKHIVRYYLNKPAKDDSDRDKFDLLITRFCSRIGSGPHNLQQRQVVDNVEDILEELCRTSRAIENESVQTATITKLRQIARMIGDARSFNTLIEGKLMSLLRDFKIRLGDTFYIPMILAEIIRVNVAVHNKFQELYHSEQARLRMETARMLHSLQVTGKQPRTKDTDNPMGQMVGQLGGLTVQMQQFIQELKKSLNDQILQNRATRASIEAEGSSLIVLISSLEESLRRSRELLTKLQELYARTDSKETH